MGPGGSIIGQPPGAAASSGLRPQQHQNGVGCRGEGACVRTQSTCRPPADAERGALALTTARRPMANGTVPSTTAAAAAQQTKGVAGESATAKVHQQHWRPGHRNVAMLGGNSPGMECSGGGAGCQRRLAPGSRR